MLLILFLVVVINAINPCGYQRLSLTKISPTTGCGMPTQLECEESVTTDVGDYGSPVTSQCIWEGPTSCYALISPGTYECRPSCFVNGKTQYTGATSCSSITNATLCDNVYIGGYGTSKICLYDTLHSTCNEEYCDYVCSGTYQKAASCSTYTNKYACQSHYYDDGTNYKNCQWSGTACGTGQKCIKICNGFQSTTNCSSITGNLASLLCPTYHETRSTGWYDCSWNGVTCNSKYPQQCYIATTPTPTCTGTPGTGAPGTSCAASFTTQATCNGGYTYNDVNRQCAWNVGAETCDDGAPCSPF